MGRHISDKIVQIDSYIDTVRLYLPRFITADEYRVIRRHSSSIRSMPREEMHPRMRFKWWAGITLFQPNSECLAFIGQAFQHHMVSRVDVALDLSADSFADAEYLKAYLDTHQVKLWRGKQTTNTYRGTTYSSKQRKVPSNLVRYADRPSKISGLPCCHVEWRIQGAQHVQRAGIKSLYDLVAINHRQFWSERLRLHDPTTCVEKLGEKRFSMMRTRRSSWLNGYCLNWTRETAYLRIGNILWRASQTEASGLNAQAIIDFIDPGSRSYMEEKDATWMLPDD